MSCPIVAIALILPESLWLLSHCSSPSIHSSVLVVSIHYGRKKNTAGSENGVNWRPINFFVTPKENKTEEFEILENCAVPVAVLDPEYRRFWPTASDTFCSHSKSLLATNPHSFPQHEVVRGSCPPFPRPHRPPGVQRTRHFTSLSHRSIPLHSGRV